MELEFDVLHVPDESWQRILTYHALPATSSDAALRLLTAVTAHPVVTPGHTPGLADTPAGSPADSGDLAESRPSDDHPADR